MSFTVVLPSVWQPWTDLCLRTMHSTLRDRLLLIDNTVANVGVSRSWNRGVNRMRDQGDDWLVIVSAAMRFGAAGGRDFIAELDAAVSDEWAIEAGECPRQPGIGFGWHLIAFPSRTFDRVGLFDENFFAYYEDNDFGHRIRCATPEWQPGVEPLWSKVPVDADLAGFAHGVKLAGVYVDPQAASGYYRRKWGGPPSMEEYFTPFGGGHGLDWWPAPYRQPSA